MMVMILNTILNLRSSILDLETTREEKWKNYF